MFYSTKVQAVFTSSTLTVKQYTISNEHRIIETSKFVHKEYVSIYSRRTLLRELLYTIPTRACTVLNKDLCALPTGIIYTFVTNAQVPVKHNRLITNFLTVLAISRA